MKWKKYFYKTIHHSIAYINTTENHATKVVMSKLESSICISTAISTTYWVWHIKSKTMCSSVHCSTSAGLTVFRGSWNFEPSRGICPFPWNFDIAAEFRGILQKLRNDRWLEWQLHLHRKNQTEMPKTTSLLIITIVYGTIVNKHNATNWQIALLKRKKW